MILILLIFFIQKLKHCPNHTTTTWKESNLLNQIVCFVNII